MLQLRYETPAAFDELVLERMGEFLQDHAANERKVSASAMTLIKQHPERQELVDELVELACEELDHFRLVYGLLKERGLPLAPDAPDPYMTQLRKAIRRKDTGEYLLDRLVLFAIVEARGCERFARVAQAVTDSKLKDFYEDLVRSESRHHAVYLRLARLYFPREQVEERLDELLDVEAEVMRKQPLRPALH